MTETSLQRFHLALVEALRERGPADLERPFTVAEIYQDLVPYRTHRDMLGVEMNGDYEHILLRLLSGEGSLLRLESEHALAEIREELDALDPNTGLYREFAAVDVRLNPASIPEGGVAPANAAAPEESDDADEELSWHPADEPIPPSDEAEAEEAPPEQIETVAVGDFENREADALVELDALAPDHPAAPAAASRTATAQASSTFESGSGLAANALEGEEAATGAGASSIESCRWCRADLPPREDLRFCPFCGQDAHMQPCRSCGEALEPGWRFCISCGTEAAD